MNGQQRFHAPYRRPHDRKQQTLNDPWMVKGVGRGNVVATGFEPVTFRV